MEKIILFLIYVAIGYLFIGLIFSIFFYPKGIKKIDEVAIAGSLGFKLIVFPGIIFFWPFLLSKWIKQN